MPMYSDFDSREAFVRSLNLFHYNLRLQQSEFSVVTGMCDDFEQELLDIKKNLSVIKQQWNNQSIEQIESVVSQAGGLNLDIMAGQKNDKLNAGYDAKAPMYRVKQCHETSKFYLLAKRLGLDHACARYHVQFPGEVTVFHTDIFSPAHEFLPPSVTNIKPEQIGHDHGVRRVLISLEDWNWGQILMFGSQSWSQWQAGDIVYWKYGVPHCSANMGYAPRISVSITGLATPNFFTLFKDEQ